MFLLMSSGCEIKGIIRHLGEISPMAFFCFLRVRIDSTLKSVCHIFCWKQMEISHQLIKSNPKKHTLQSDNGLKIFRDNKINFSKDLLKLLQNVSI